MSLCYLIIILLPDYYYVTWLPDSIGKGS